MKPLQTSRLLGFYRASGDPTEDFVVATVTVNVLLPAGVRHDGRAPVHKVLRQGGVRVPVERPGRHFPEVVSAQGSQ